MNISLKDNHAFWTTGNGKDFLNWAGIAPETLQSAYDSELFFDYDREADRLVQKWLAEGSFGDIMKNLHGNPNAKIPEDFTALRISCNILPHWVNRELIQSGSRLCQRSGVMGLLVLRNFALLGGYYFANLTKPLVATGALEKGAVHRLYHTLGFWVEVSRSTENAAQMRMDVALRTRFIHSASRLMIMKKYPDWDAEQYGTPLNTADMIATNIAFTLYFVYGLEKLNFPVSAEEEAGVFHLWKYVTWLLGVPAELIPENRRQALSFFKFWTAYQAPPDSDSASLADALIHENTPVSLLKLDLMKKSMGYIHKSVANYLISDDIRSSLEIPGVTLGSVIPAVLKLKNSMSADSETQVQRGNREQLSVLEDYRENSKGT